MRRRLAIGGAALATLVSLLSSACAPAGPRAVADGDRCEYCRMEVTDERFGAQVMTRTGKAHLFDSVECVAGFLATADTATLRGTWVHDVERPGEWVDATEAGYLVDAALGAPMGRVVAFASPAAAASAVARIGGTPVSWHAVRTDSGGITAHRGR